MSFEGRCHCQCKMCRSEQCVGRGDCYPSQANDHTYQPQQQSQEKNVLSSRYIKFCEMIAKKVHIGRVVRDIVTGYPFQPRLYNFFSPMYFMMCCCHSQGTIGLMVIVM